MLCSRYMQAYAVSAAGVGISGSEEVAVFAACVLQRLPLLKPPVAPHLSKNTVWSRQRGLETGELKDYPEGVSIQSLWLGLTLRARRAITRSLLVSRAPRVTCPQQFTDRFLISPHETPRKWQQRSPE